MVAIGGRPAVDNLLTGRQTPKRRIKMSRDISMQNQAIMARIQALGYRTGIGEMNGRWIATAKRDSDGQFHVAKGETEDEVVALLAESAGVTSL